MRTLRWGVTGDDVAQLQRSLQIVSYYSGASNGKFGFQTQTAVEAFQRAHSLSVDGVAGSETLAALGLIGPTGENEGPSRRGRAASVHIGVNSIDPAGYAGWSGPLDGSENDARSMAEIAQAEGFSVKQLLTRYATTRNVLGTIEDAARLLRSGDLFLLSYSGHGGQVPVPPGTGPSVNPEVDGQDETWCLYDRMLLDNELWASFAAFYEGVNIVLLSDSCHSGTVYRVLGGDQDEEYAAVKGSFYENLGLSRAGGPAGEIPHPVTMASESALERHAVQKPGHHPQRKQATLSVRERIVQPASDMGNGDSSSLRTRELPFGINQRIIDQQLKRYHEIWRRTQSRGPVVANGVSISGCAGNQLSVEVNGAGVFTTKVNNIWDKNTFIGRLWLRWGRIIPPNLMSLGRVRGHCWK